MRNVFRITIKFCVIWLFNVLSLFLCMRFLNGIDYVAETKTPVIIDLMFLGLVLTLLNLLVRPLILLLMMPFSMLTAGLYSIVINGLCILLINFFSNTINIRSIWTGILATFVIAIINFLVTTLLPIDDDMLYFDIVGKRILQSEKIPRDGKQGIIALEIDGLSYPRIKKAIESGKMPFLQELKDSGKYVLHEYDCGVPSQTSSCQAGIMYGSNENICAFRWYDKAQKKVISSSSFGNAEMIEAHIRKKNSKGLLKNGLSISNIISGSAKTSLFTVSSFFSKSVAEQRKRNINLYLFSSHPYVLTKSFIFTVFDIISENFEYLVTKITNKKPRLDRFHGFYPVIRGFTNVFLRDISTKLIVDEIYRGGPAVYTTFMGHDEIAHHSGPDSFEARQALSGIDRAIRKIYSAAEKSTARDYRVVILSDHGQSFGATFKQRYGKTLRTVIQEIANKTDLSQQNTQVVGIENTADNNANLRAALAELHQSGKENSLTNGAYNLLTNAVDKNESTEKIKKLESQKSDILVLASGNLSNVYFSFTNHRTSYDEIDTIYPGLILKLSEHPGVGLIIVLQNGRNIAYGKSGSIDLETGVILSGENPLLLFGKPEVRRKQLQYLASFENIGDLIIFSPVYEDGTVASYEELIGSHGGLGGQQTDPFIFCDKDISIPDNIINSREVYSVLQGIRETPMRLLEKRKTEEKTSFHFKELWNQIKNTKKWTPMFREMTLFQSSAFKTIADDPEFTGPGLLIFVLSYLSASLSYFFLAKNLGGSLSSYIASLFNWIGVVPEITMDGRFFSFILPLINWSVFLLAAKATIAVFRKEISWPSLLRVLLFGSAINFLWLTVLIFDSKELPTIIIIILQILLLAQIILGVGNIEGKIRILILPVSLVMVIVVFGSTALIVYFLAFVIHRINIRI